MHIRIADIVERKVYGEKELYGDKAPVNTRAKYNQTNLLFLHYSTPCHLCEVMEAHPAMFVLDLNAKMKATGKEELVPSPDRITRTGVFSALTLIRSVFDCRNNNHSKLISQEEYTACAKAKYRLVKVAHISTVDLEPILQSYRLSVRVMLVHTDPRTIAFRHIGDPSEPSEEQRRSRNLRNFGQKLCFRMVSDTARLDEYEGQLHSFYKSFSDEMFLLFPKKVKDKAISFFKLSPMKRRNEKYNETSVKMENLETFVTQYQWLNSSKLVKDAKNVDERCDNFYDAGVYSPLKEKSTLILNNITYPIRSNKPT